MHTYKIFNIIFINYNNNNNKSDNKNILLFLFINQFLIIMKQFFQNYYK